MLHTQCIVSSKSFASLVSKALHAVAFTIMDLDNTDFIEKDEVRRCLTVVLKEDPRIRLDDDMLADIIEKVIHCHDLCSHTCKFGRRHLTSVKARNMPGRSDSVKSKCH